jgi:ribosomal protein L29
MKKNDFADVKKLGIPEIKDRVDKTRTEIQKLVIDKNMGNMADRKSIFKKRKDLAQLLTVLTQKELLVTLEEQNG